MPLYKTHRNRLALRLLLRGPATTADLRRAEGLDPTCGGIPVYQSFVENGVAKVVGREGKAFVYALTADGLLLAHTWHAFSAALIRRDDCCEAAILGIEGEHDPYPVCARQRGPVRAS